MITPYSDPLTFWSRMLLRLGLILALGAIAPAVADFLIFKGGIIVIAIIALNTLAPLAVLSLVVGAGLWVAGKLKK